jgi:hypothetical protein
MIRESRDEYQAGVSSGEPRQKTKSGGQSKASLNESMSPNPDFWFYLADVELYGDSDRDGYFSGIDLLFDVDTYYSAADIYAVAYLSYEGGPWEEYAVTEDFTIFGSSGTDDYVIVTDLVSGYPRGDYDILIEVFDAHTGEFRITVNNGGGGASDIFLLMLLGISAGIFGLRRLRYR